MDGMKTTPERAFETVRELVRTFDANKHAYLGPDYPEAQARKDFIDKFFIALGWDVNHDIQKNPYEQEVKVEPTVAIGATQRHADYAFRLAPNFNKVCFFVEAKKPSPSIATKENYFQVIRYGWNGQTPLAVLTDFQQFHILDCRYKPDPDTALNCAVAKYHYTEYAKREKFDWIYWLFSREAVATGSLEKRAAELPKPRGKAVQRGLFPGAYKPVDESFLEELDEFRTELARGFKATDPDLDSETLTELAQRTLDRLVFLRFLEDKGIEIQRLVDNFGVRGTVWEDFITACRRLDRIYNGIVFKQHSILDAPTFRLGDAIFRGICERLASVNTPYDFNSIPIHILGSIYERFLGKVIVATAKRVHLEDKAQVRKAGGVYYTPEYISRYIVENTVGKLIATRAPADIATMRFADIACGSGSFLLCIYDLLIRHHGNYYNSLPEPDKASAVKRGDCINRDGKLYVSLRKKREILLNNIFGVDIDAQAVEVTQFSLSLRLLQDETTVSAQQYLLDFQHIAQMKKLLPDLSKNIICGNSLIGTDILDNQLFPSDEERKLNPMNFADAFPQVMERGGFDTIVGNPPYIRIQTMQESSSEAVDYLAKHYRTATRGNYDIYVVFAERALALLNPRGKFGYILPHKFFNSQYGQPLRNLLGQGKHVAHIVHFGSQQVFRGATTYTCLLFLDKAPCEQCQFVKVNNLTAWQTSGSAEEGAIPAISFTESEWSFTVGKNADLFKRLRTIPLRLGDVADIFVGLQTSADDVFILDLVEEKPQSLRLHSKILNAGRTFEKGLFFPLVSGTDVQRYSELPRRQYIVFPYEVFNESAKLLAFADISKRYPKTAAYLLENKKRLEGRENGRMKGPDWHGYIYLKNMTRQSLIKLCVPRLVQQLHAAFDHDGTHFLDNVDVGGVTLKTGFADQGLKYLLALLNCRLMQWYFPQISAPFRGGWMSANRQFLSQLPFRLLDLSDPTDNKRHRQIVTKVEAMLEVKKQLASAKTDKDKTYYGNKFTSLDRQVDSIIYDLYGLTEDEIKLIEGAADHS